ncbi:MAG: serine protease [Psychromonas sp.]
MIKKNILLVLMLFTSSTYANESVNRVSFVSAEPERNEITPRIIGGTVADINDFKFYARLVATDFESFYSHLCGATLLNEHYVLTAAHCVDVSMTGFEKESLSIVVNNPSFSGVRITELKQVESIQIHPDYNPNNYDNDIAIVRLVSKITDDVEYITVPTDDDKLYYEQLASMSVTGLGYIDKMESFPTTLLTTEVTLLSDSECDSLVYFYFGQEFVASNALCVIPIAENGSCSGDSGGPLTYVGDDGKNKQAGLVSYGAEECVKEGVPTVYTELHGYSNWIENTMNMIEEVKETEQVEVVDSSGGGGAVNHLFLFILLCSAILRRKLSRA